MHMYMYMHVYDSDTHLCGCVFYCSKQHMHVQMYSMNLTCSHAPLNLKLVGAGGPSHSAAYLLRHAIYSATSTIRT